MATQAETPWQAWISADPAICHGKPCIAGTRVMVSVILDNLAAGACVEQVLADYPSVTRDGVMAALRYGAELAKGRFVDVAADRG